MSTSASRYEIRRKLGEGGMAEVLEAIATGEAGFTRRVAIKRLRAGHEEDPSFARMFLDEARIASRLHHGGIVSVLDYGVVDGQPFQILEFVDGESARALAKRGQRMGKPMPIEVALHVVTEVARALHYAHAEYGVVHRDVKPANILVSRTGDVKLADFGIAFATERAEKTQTGMAKGTPGFMAPEQILGATVDARTDVFALGCALHALATGKSPLLQEGNLERALRGEPLDVAPELPEDVAAIVRRAIDPLPSKRHANAAAFAEETGAALATRLRGDSKGTLLRWLESIEESAPRGAALDALLMPEALLEREEEGTWKLETTKREPTPRLPPPSPPAPPRRWLAPVVALGALAIAAGVGSRFVHSSVPSAPPPAPVASTPATVSAAKPPEPPPAASSIAPAPAVVTTSLGAPRPRHVPATSAPSAPPSADLLGTLAVRGGAYRGAEVLIDGRVEPFGAPHYFDLPIGKHHVELRLDGGAVAHGDVELLPTDTPTAPRTWP